MIYVPPELHRAMKQVALDEGWFVSDAYAAAARDFLAARAVAVEPDPEPDPATAAPTSMTLSDLVEAIERQGRRIEDVLASTASLRAEAANSGQAPAGTKAAEGMRVLLGILKVAGGDGLSSRELSAKAYEAGIKSGTAETAKVVLRAAGLVRWENRRWFIDGAG